MEKLPWKRQPGRYGVLVGDVLIGAVVSVVTALGLWAVLPRGVVLTREARAQDLRGEQLLDTWTLRNSSSLPIRITSVTVASPETYDANQDKILEVELPVLDGDGGVLLAFDDHVLETRRVEQNQPWRRLEVPPGDTLQATVMTNRTLRIKYRRAGFFGILERREVSIHGYA
jgi:hypothetical protein